MNLPASFALALEELSTLNTVCSEAAITYILALPKSYGAYGKQGLAMQIPYILGNCQGWQGPKAREVKKLWNFTRFAALPEDEINKIIKTIRGKE